MPTPPSPDFPTTAAGWSALVLAGERPGGDPLARAMGVEAKALIKVGGRTMLERVVEALLEVPSIARVVVLAQKPERLSAALPASGRVHFALSGDGIAASIARVAGSQEAPWPVLVTTADNALLTPARVEAFLDGAAGADLAVGLGERRIVEARFPGTRRTWLRFADGHFSGANLFALGSARCLPALTHWQGIEQDRKKGLKLVASFGPVLLLRVLTRTIGLGDGLARVGRRMGFTARPVILDAEAPIDVDRQEDLALVESIIARRAQATPAPGQSA